LYLLALTIKRRKERGSPMDVFSYGVILWQMITKESPWQKQMKEDDLNMEDLKELIVVEKERLEIPKECTKELKVYYTIRSSMK
jgi:serine/threonine protein kinase